MRERERERERDGEGERGKRRRERLIMTEGVRGEGTQQVNSRSKDRHNVALATNYKLWHTPLSYMSLYMRHTHTHTNSSYITIGVHSMHGQVHPN